MAMSSMLSKSVLAGTPVLAARPSAQRPAARAGVVVRAADRPLFVPGADPPSYLDGSLAGEAFATQNLGTLCSCVCSDACRLSLALGLQRLIVSYIDDMQVITGE